MKIPQNPQDFEKSKEEYLSLTKQGKYKEADEIYWSSVYPEVERRFVVKSKQNKEYDWLIVQGGFAIEHNILVIKALKPKKVCFLVTDKVKDEYLDRIIEKTGLKPSQYTVEILDFMNVDASDVYERIKNNLEMIDGQNIALDLTRGKRIISVGAGIAAAFLGFDLVYINKESLANSRRGIPGTEALVKLKNPFQTFGDIELHEARQLFNYQNYGAALFIYRKLKDKIPDPRTILFEELLAESYMHWDSFNLKAAQQKLDKALEKAGQYSIRIPERIHENKKALDILTSRKEDESGDASDEYYLHIIIDLYTNAINKAKLGLFGPPINRLYRAIEMIAQYRLRKHGIKNTSDAEIPEEIAKEYVKLTHEIYGFQKTPGKEIGLKDAYILLYILKDELLKNESIKSLQNMFGIIRARDMSIVAHGLNLVGEKAFANMANLTEKFAKEICKSKNLDFNDLVKQHTFSQI